MRAFVLGLTFVLAASAATVYDAPLNQLTVVRGIAAPDTAVKHDAAQALRVEAGKQAGDAVVRSAPVQLTIGKRYELSGWVRTENLTVRDTDRSPIATGATLAMASMPFDVHATSVAGTRGWTRLSMKFTASRSQDQIQLTVGNGGAFDGRAWFAGVSIDEASAKDEWPAREAVKTFGPAYRYPQAGWIYLHIEGEPYERGYQHGYLMAREIPEYMARCAADLGTNEAGWGGLRTQANALFLRGFDREILEEMRGIADGASDAGARWQGRRLDLVDVVVTNITVELGELRSAMTVTPTGLENLKFTPPSYFDKKRDGNDVPVHDRCSAFAATGPATRDGKMVIGHVTWWPLTLAEQTNVMLDVKPAKGHRVLMQSYPGGIESGTDWYQNDAGLVLTETTIRQTQYNPQGTPVAYRARLAVQYADNIDDMVRLLGTKNNGLYTNEWLMGDGKTNEIAMYELGTVHTKLWRSSRNEWFGGTAGFYWGNNNAKDLTIRTEYLPDPHGTPEYVPYVPGVRDVAWTGFYQKYKGAIDEQFAYTAFRTAPLVSGSTMDAKVITSEMANKMMVWGAFGKPNQREWVAARGGYEKNDGLFPAGYTLFNATPSESLTGSVQQNELERLAPKTAEAPRPGRTNAARTVSADRLWKGWIVPAGVDDTWFAAGSTTYLRVLEAEDVEKELDAFRIEYRGLKLAADTPITRFRMAETKGVLFLDALRRKMGDDKFLELMNSYFAENTTKTVTAASFLAKAGTTFDFTEPADGPAYSVSDIGSRLASAVIVFGTMKDAGANRYAAEQLQQQYLGRFESRVPIYKDFEVTDEMLAHKDVVFVGRPEANQALSAWAKQIGIEWDGAVFRVDGKTHAGERDALTLAAKNPMDAGHMVLVIAGNDALRTVKTASAGNFDRTAYVISRPDASPAAARGGRRQR